MNETLSDFLRGAGFTRFQLTRLPTGHATVPVTINGVEGAFVVDSGAGGSVIDRAVADRFELVEISGDSGSPAQATGAGGHIEISRFRVGSFAIEDVSVDLPTLRATDLSAVVNALQAKADAKIDGVIGLDVLNEFDAVFDVANNHLFLKLN